MKFISTATILFVQFFSSARAEDTGSLMGPIFNISTRTCDVDHGGTDDDVFITIYVKKGGNKFSFTRELDNPGINDFEEGSLDRFVLTSGGKTMDQITGIVVKLRGDDGWCMLEVDIEHSGNSYSFYYNGWLDDDGQTGVLTPDN